MGRLEALKRTIILQMSMIGLVFQTIMYVYVWQTVYNDIMQSGMWRSFHRKGFWLLAAVYYCGPCGAGGISQLQDPKKTQENIKKAKIE